MSMNSFSFKQGQSNVTSQSDESLESEVIDVGPQGLHDVEKVDLIRMQREKVQIIDREAIRQKYQAKNNDPRRIAPRYPLSLTVIVYGKMHSIRTKSINISVSGVLLHDAIPHNFAHGDVEVVFIYQRPGTKEKKYMMFRAEIIGQSETPSPRLRFQSSFKSSLADLEGILLTSGSQAA